jgi:hypothetical protein
MPIARYKQAHTICPVNLQTIFFFFKEKKNKKKKYQLNRKLGILSSRDWERKLFSGGMHLMFCTQAVQVMYLMCVFMMCKWCIECIHARYTNDYTNDGNGLQICTAGLEFESGRAFFIRVWDSRDFTRSPGSIKCAFRRMGFPRIQIKKKDIQMMYLAWRMVVIHFQNVEPKI